MKYTFTAHGHHNILATHKTTLEITKDSELTKKGDCIVAAGADFSLQQLQRIIGSGSKIRLAIAAEGIKEEITAIANERFSSNHEIVFRKGNFISERTLGIQAEKAAANISRELVEKLKDSRTTVSVTIESYQQ